MNLELSTIVEGIRAAEPRALAHFKLGRQTTPQIIVERLGPPEKSWDDGVDLCLAYSTPLGTLFFTFAHCRFFFGRQRQMLTSVELNETDCDQSGSTGEE